MKIYNNIVDLIGNTPLVKINALAGKYANIYAKLEYFNPAGSVKDRVAKSMIEEALNTGKITNQSVIIEPTSGNTGIGLALYCATFGMKLILTMPENMSDERKKLLKAYGVELVLTPKNEGMQGAVKKAFELAQIYENSFIPMQFENSANPLIHQLTTAKEIINDLDGNVDVLVAGIGTGGTLCGCAKGLKDFNKNIEIVGVEPLESPLITAGQAGVHGIQGIGANFIPANFDACLVDKVITVSTLDAVNTMKTLATNEGIFVGISSGASLFAAIDLANNEAYKNKNIVVIFPDSGERYLSALSFD